MTNVQTTSAIFIIVAYVCLFRVTHTESKTVYSTHEPLLAPSTSQLCLEHLFGIHS